MSVRRLVVRVRALHAAHLLRSRKALIRDSNPPKPASINRWISALAAVGKGGDLVWHSARRRKAEDN